MATTTPNLGLTLPTGNEKVSRQILNGNMQLIDDNCITKYDSGSQYIRKDGNNSFIEYRRIGNVVTVRAFHKGSSALIGTWENYFFTQGGLPEEFRPKVSAMTKCVTDRGNSAGCAFYVNPNGNVYIGGRWSGLVETSDVIEVSVTYPV